MKLVKKASVVALSMLAMNVAQAYTETGKLQCYATDEFKDKDTIVLFVNGIDNRLDEAESSRKKLSEIYNNCDKCDFRKSYNRTQGFSHDSRELASVGSMEFFALQKASIDTLEKLESLINQAIDKQYGYLLENEEIKINNHKTTVKELKAINENIFNQMTKFQETAKDNDNLFFIPDKHGTDFDTALSNFLKKSTDTNFWSSSHAKAYEFFSRAIFLKQMKYLRNQFMFQYRESLTTIYFSTSHSEKFHKDLSEHERDNITKSIRKSVEHLQNNITEFVLAGKKVVVVAHSQGNHMIELVHAKLAVEKKDNPEFMNAIRVVGVAPVASTTPNNAYISWTKDKIVQWAYQVNAYANPLQPNFSGGPIKKANNHSFTDVYLSDGVIGKYTIPTNIDDINNYPKEIQTNNNHKDISSLDVVRHLITGAKNSAKAIPAQITTNSLLTAQLRWEGYDDMDLYIHEPPKPPLFYKTQVYYENKTGRFGYLDLDDTDGDGPEHYYINPNTSCNDLSNKTWDFYIHQHPNGGFKATAHFMLKLGNNRVTSHSFAKETWTKNRPDIYVPSSILNRPSVAVTFAPYTAGSPTLDYTIKVTDSVTNLDGGENNNN